MLRHPFPGLSLRVRLARGAIRACCREIICCACSDQAPLIRFVEDNWDLGRIGDGSLDELAGSLDDSFDFQNPHPTPLILDADRGEPVTLSSAR